MRCVSALSLIALLLLAGCANMLSGPRADMAEAPPPGAAPGARGHRHGRTHHHSLSGMSYADDAPVMMMPPGAQSPSEPPNVSGPSGMSFGSGDASASTADITPRSATPDTEVSYGKNSSSN